MFSPQAHKTTLEQKDAACPARAVNQFSGEDIIPFDDCEAVKDARQRRVARILGVSAPTHKTPLADTIESPVQQGADDQPLEVRKQSTLFH